MCQQIGCHDRLVALAERMQELRRREANTRTLLRRLNEVLGISLGSEAVSRYPGIPLLVLSDDKVLGQFLGVFDWVVSRIRGS